MDLSRIVELVAEGKLTEIEAERLINALSRFQAGVPTGVTQRDSK